MCILNENTKSSRVHKANTQMIFFLSPLKKRQFIIQKFYLKALQVNDKDTFMALVPQITDCIHAPYYVLYIVVIWRVLKTDAKLE